MQIQQQIAQQQLIMRKTVLIPAIQGHILQTVQLVLLPGLPECAEELIQTLAHPLPLVLYRGEGQ